MNQQRKNAFTLVELIVVIVILAILGTIAFISLQWYSKDARDSTRVSDISTIKTSLELFHLDAGKYPLATDTFTVTYSWSQVWNQGTFGDSTFSNVKKLDKVPTDPLTDKKYTYSITSTRQEYQIAGIMEGEWIALVNNTFAWDVETTALVSGNYNWVVLKTLSGSNCEVLSLPSIISNQGNTTTNLTDILNWEWLVYHWHKNLPTNYRNSKYNADGGFGFTSWKLIVYSDDNECSDLYTATSTGITARSSLITNLQTAYSGTILEWVDNVKSYTNIDTSDSTTVENIWWALVNNILWWNVEISNNSNWWSGWWGSTSWNDIDSKCGHGDIVVWTQTWAWCNSTLWSWVEWGKQDNGSNGTISYCRGYTSTNLVWDPDCALWNPIMASDANAKDYFDLKQPGWTTSNWDAEYNTIWWKLYTWDQAMWNVWDGACPTWRHVPSSAEWEVLEEYLDDQNRPWSAPNNCRVGAPAWECDWLWWNSQSWARARTLTNLLQIPLAWYRGTSGTQFLLRWSHAHLWTSDYNGWSPYNRVFIWDAYNIFNTTYPEASGYSVRCIKD